MKSLLMSVAGTVPSELRDWVRQGSTSIEIATGPDAAHAVDDSVDRIVVWSDRSGALPRGIDALEPRRVFFVSPDRRPPIGTDDQVFVWPEDRDRLRTMLTVGNG